MISHISQRLIAFGFALFLAAPAAAQATFECQSQSGLWSETTQRLEGVVCELNGEPSDLYQIDFAKQTAQFASAIPNPTGALRYFRASENVLFYADDATFYALDRAKLQVIWQKPWAHAEPLPADPFDPQHHALITQNAGQYWLHMVRISGDTLEETLTVELGSALPIHVQWQSQRLVLLTTDRLLYWPRQTTDTSNESPAHSNLEAVALPKPLQMGEFALDPNGFMLLNREQKKLTYYRFDVQSWTSARINSTATLHALGAGTKYAMGVTIDMNTVRVVARLGSVLQNRFEAKYWKLPSAPHAATVMGQDDIAALDGGTDQRIQTIDTTDVTWKRLALIELPTQGRMTALENDELITVHPSGKSGIIFWNARTGAQIRAIPNDALKNFGAVRNVLTIPGLNRTRLITFDNETFVIYDTHTEKLSIAHAYEPQTWSTLPRAIQVLPNALVVHAIVHGQSQWEIYPDNPSQPVTPLALATPTISADLHSAKEKWYGYCTTQGDCFRPTQTLPEHPKILDDVQTQAENTSHAPSILAWILCFFALLSMFGVMLWRHGFGRQSKIKTEHSDADEGIAPTDLFDDKNRRYVTDRDQRYFLAPHCLATPLFRVCISIVLGILIGLAIAAPTFYDDTLTTFLSWVVVLGMPVSAIVWIATSWNYWNRYYLLRFGCLTEGKWLNCAQTNPSIIYEPTPNQVYELNFRQWQRVDFVPIVLFDPSRPNFVVQYTGVELHSRSVSPETIQAKPKKASVFDIPRATLVLSVLAITLVLTQILFHNTFPNPLSAWKLDRIAASVSQSKDETTFTLACLEACSDQDTACAKQCHQRQLKLILEEANIFMTSEPIQTTAQFLDQYRQTLTNARQILERPDLTCAQRQSQLAQVALWPDDVSTAFWNVYADPESFQVAGLDEIYTQLQHDAKTFKTLCDATGTCANSSQNCPEPPQCSGRVTYLKNRVCAMHLALSKLTNTEEN